jgi:hypothetical protein
MMKKYFGFTESFIAAKNQRTFNNLIALHSCKENTKAQRQVVQKNIEKSYSLLVTCNFSFQQNDTVSDKLQCASTDCQKEIMYFTNICKMRILSTNIFYDH